MTADVLIVGAGSAGSILAERLSAESARRVTVLEMGADRSDPVIHALTQDATLLPLLPRSPVAHRYRTQLTTDGRHPAELVRGMGLGGSGAINGGYFRRPSVVDFADAVPGWSWAEVESHYRAVVTDLDFPDPGGGGPIAVRRVPELGGAAAEFTTAACAAGFAWLPDLNAAGDRPGVGAVPLNIVDGVRITPGTAFLEPALLRPNLTVHNGVRVTRLRVVSGRAVGVEAVGPDGAVFFGADTVVLSAGAVASAHLLMVSGVGPADELATLGIPVVADLPVGESFSDHPEWLMSTDWVGASGRPILEAVLLADGLEVRPYPTGFAAMAGGGSATSPDIGVALTRPRSRGRLTLASADPTVPPRIEHRYDAVHADIGKLRDGCDMVAEILGTSTELGEPRWSTSQHLCGTSPMGTGERSVVDPMCRVRGVDGLAVIDGSVLPRVPSCGPHAAIAVLAHRAAEFFIA